MAALTVPTATLAPLLLLLLAGSPFFANTVCCFKKRAMRFKGEARDISPDSEAQSETTTYIPETQQMSDQILGIEGQFVPVYVLINSKAIILNCLSETLLMGRITDPKCQWTGPFGPITEETRRFVLTDDGSLEIHSVQGIDAGSYTCQINYVSENKPMATETNFMVYVYHMPGRSIHLSSEFTVQACETNLVASFEKYLLEQLENLIHNLACEIPQWRVECHASTDTLETLTYKLRLQFAVFPLMMQVTDLCRSSECEHSNSSIKEAYEKIRTFFEGQNIDSSHGDNLNYVPGSLIGVKKDHCIPGFGKNISTIDNNTACSGCCVTCPPGSFSAKYDTVCILCAAGSYNGNYGQTACENCPGAQSSNEKGAQTVGKCHRVLPTWVIPLTSCAATSLLLVTIWMVTTKCCKKTVAAHYIRETESEVKKRLQTFANVASDAEIQEQRNKLSPIKVQRKKQPKHKVDFLEEESVELLSNDDATDLSTSAGVSPSPDVTEPSELETSFEDQSPPTLEKDFTPTDLPSSQQKFVNIMKEKRP
ncbi:zona pellucida-binding protein 2-like isoform X2 [Paroedura picta]|uniref:zona pellucida-binding protein 2-like isoform X2 n=1 Tax=Paroedura picta TaxID=143630 RepID=UPI00405676E1